MKRFPNYSDDELLVETINNHQAFGEFYYRHSDKVLSYFLYQTKDPELATDLCGETFAAALVASYKYKPDREPATAWLFAIARRKLIDSIRKGQIDNRARLKLNVRPLELTDEDIESINARYSDTDHQILNDILAELPKDQRDVLLARVVDEAEYSEIAARLSSSESVVRKRVSRSLETVRTKYEKYAQECA